MQTWIYCDSVHCASCWISSICFRQMLLGTLLLHSLIKGFEVFISQGINTPVELISLINTCFWAAFFQLVTLTMTGGVKPKWDLLIKIQDFCRHTVGLRWIHSVHEITYKIKLWMVMCAQHSQLSVLKCKIWNYMGYFIPKHT